MQKFKYESKRQGEENMANPTDGKPQNKISVLLTVLNLMNFARMHRQNRMLKFGYARVVNGLTFYNTKKIAGRSTCHFKGVNIEYCMLL